MKIGFFKVKKINVTFFKYKLYSYIKHTNFLYKLFIYIITSILFSLSVKEKKNKNKTNFKELFDNVFEAIFI